MQKLGSILEVEATVGADNRTIELDVAPAFKEFEGFINYGTPITTSKATSGSCSPKTASFSRCSDPTAPAA
jgi:hypothetical protein